MKITSAKLFLAEYNRSETPEFPKKSKVVGIRIYTDEGIYGDGEVAGIQDRKSTRLNSSHTVVSRMPSSA